MSNRHFYWPALFFITFLFISSNLFAMDGIAVTSCKWSEGGYGHNYAEVAAYMIENDAVKSKKPLYTFSDTTNNEWHTVYCASLNPSGTHVVFYRNWSNRHIDERAGHPLLSIADIETGTWKDIITLPYSAAVIWWLHDGSIVVLPGDRCTLEKYTLKLENGETTVSREVIGRFKDKSQHFYIDISMDAKFISYRVYKGTCDGSDGISTDFAGPIPSDPSVLMGRDYGAFYSTCGCGNGVSPLGAYSSCFSGSGHNTLGFEVTADASRQTSVSTPSDIQAWSAESIPVSGGTDFSQGWAVNSDEWTVASLGCDSRFAREGADQWLINRIDKKAINASRGCLESTKKRFHRGDMWVATQDDVIPSLWEYVENRETYRKQWNDIMAGLPDSAQVVSLRPDNRAVRLAESVNSIRISRCAITVSFARDNVDVVEVFDISGKKLYAGGARGKTAEIPAEHLAAGRYILRMWSAGETDAVPIAIAD